VSLLGISLFHVTPPTFLRSRTRHRLGFPNLPGVLEKVVIGLENWASMPCPSCFGVPFARRLVLYPVPEKIKIENSINPFIIDL